MKCPLSVILAVVVLIVVFPVAAASQTVIAHIPLGDCSSGFSCFATKLAVDPGTNRLYATASSQPGDLLIVNTLSNRIAATAGGVAESPNLLSVNRSNHLAYVTDQDSGGLPIFDRTGLMTIFGAGAPCCTLDMDVNPVTNRVYLTSGINQLVIANGTTGDVMRSVQFDFAVGSIGSIAVDSALNRYAYVFCPVVGSCALHVLDGATNHWVSTIGHVTGGVHAVNTRTHRLYIATANQLQVIDLVGLRVIARTTLSAPAEDVVVDPNLNVVFVSLSGTNNIALIDAVTNHVAATVNTGAAVGPLAFNSATNRLYVGQGNSIAVIKFPAARR